MKKEETRDEDETGGEDCECTEEDQVICENGCSGNFQVFLTPPIVILVCVDCAEEYEIASSIPAASLD